MPARIDIRRGKYASAILATQRAIIADSIWGAEGEVACRRGEYEKAYDLLKVAVSRDDALQVFTKNQLDAHLQRPDPVISSTLYPI